MTHDSMKSIAELCLEIEMLRKNNNSLRQDLRDQFAMAAITGFTGNNAIFAHDDRCGWSLVNCTTQQLCQAAYGIADDMLEVREQS